MEVETTTDRVHGYGKVYALGHPAIADLFDGPVVVEEKVDGSQFTFGFVGGALVCRSNGAQIDTDAAPKLFDRAIESARAMEADALPGAMYRCEYLSKPKHNTIAYARTPAKWLVLLDVETSPNAFMTPAAREAEGLRLGLETIPVLHVGDVTDLGTLRAFLGRESFLGGHAIEGVVVKNHARWGKDGHTLKGKIVSEEFKEKHSKDWKLRNPGKADILETLGDSLRTDARWVKAVQRRREAGTLEGTPRDIGALVLAVQEDIKAECADEIKEALFAWAWSKLSRDVIRGLPEWYKARLAEAQPLTPLPLENA